MSSRVETILAAIGISIANKKGRRIWAICPFHNDHSPTNFFVRISGKRKTKEGREYDATGQNHCFVCKRGGSLPELVAFVRGIDIEEAKKFVDALGRGYAPPKRHVRVVSRLPTLGRTKFKMPMEIIFEPLDEWVTPARRYAKDRCLTAEEIELFRIGYAVDGKLAGRIVIPWMGRDRQPAGYSARTFVGDEPPYLTPSAAENSDRRILFGEHLWPAPGPKREVVIVTEGSFNALAARRIMNVDIGGFGGVDNLEPAHAIKLSTFKLVILLTDPDAPGDQAANALASMLGRHTMARRARLPENKDADLLFRKSPEILRKILQRVII